MITEKLVLRLGLDLGSRVWKIHEVTVVLRNSNTKSVKMGFTLHSTGNSCEAVITLMGQVI